MTATPNPTGFVIEPKIFCRKPLTAGEKCAILTLASGICTSGGIGRLAGFRCQCSLRACGFDSRLVHLFSPQNRSDFEGKMFIYDEYQEKK